MTGFHITRLASAVTVLALLTACSSQSDSKGATDGTKPQVATLTSAPATTAPRVAAAEGVQMRLDTTDEETARYWDVYQDCLLDHGVKRQTDTGGVSAGVGSKGVLLDRSGEPKAAYVACAARKPLEPIELDPARNPNFAAQWQENVRCLREHGLKVHVTKPGEWTWDSSDTGVPDNEAEIEKQCIVETFGAKKN
ncbi:hypothetical protein ACIG87_03450 [Micromonospora sp. NPDC051925]|uniref:hypothetical protein n=1 Tax=Micromonospora sp. NPDC051925 TaxID=3364288 RepID=UPI0037C8F4F3